MIIRDASFLAMASNVMTFRTILSIVIFFLHIFITSCTERPIIGILAQELPQDVQNHYPSATSYIAASYVKAVESSGARAAPILINRTETYYRSLLNSLNGVLLPGGGAELQPGYPYYNAAATIYKIATQMNQNGTFFPILAVCLGFEAILVIANNHTNIQTRCNVLNQNYPLHLHSKYKESLTFSTISREDLTNLKNFPFTVNNHRWCTTARNFTKSSLPKQWKILATSTSSDGLEFIANVEHRLYPFIAVQFHPEKVAFEWYKNQHFPRSSEALSTNRHFYDLLIKLSKFNDNKFSDEEAERDCLIYNYNPIYETKDFPEFLQIYVL